MESIMELASYGLPVAFLLSGVILFMRKFIISKRDPVHEEQREELQNQYVKGIRERQKEIDKTVKALHNENKVSEDIKKEIEEVLDSTVKKIEQIKKKNNISDLWDSFE